MALSLRLVQHSGRVRRNRVIEEVPLARSWRRIDFVGSSATAIAIPWGDLATAWFSTGIPNIETYAVVPRVAAIASHALNWVRPLLASAPGQTLLHRLANRAGGPSEEQLPRRVAERFFLHRFPPGAFDLARRYEDEESSYGGRYGDLLCCCD